MNELEQEFTRMVRKQKSTIYTVCLMFSDDSGEVDDMVQETLVNLWRGFERFRREANERTWVWRVAMNTCISADRKKRSRSEGVTSLGALGISGLGTTDEPAADKLLRQIEELQEEK